MWGIPALLAQHFIDLQAELLPAEQKIIMVQKVQYVNDSPDTLKELYFLDWQNSFSTKETPLGARFAEEYSRRFQFAKDEERGSTKISKILHTGIQELQWNRLTDQIDVVAVKLPKDLLPGETFELTIHYTTKIQDNKFTRYGYDKKDATFALRYWYLTPALYTKEWKLYSNKNLDDHTVALANYNITFTVPENYYVQIPLDKKNSTKTSYQRTTTFNGNNRLSIPVYFYKDLAKFNCFKTDQVEYVTSLDDPSLNIAIKTPIIKRIFEFTESELGKYPFKKIMVSDQDAQIDPVYGINQLPDILRPFPDGFQYEIEQLKAILNEYLRTTLALDYRTDVWLKDAIHIYLMQRYIDVFYPDIKMIGKLSSIIGLRWFHAADLEFNDQYYLLHKNTLRRNLHQSLATPQDSLVKFNKNIANPYKASIGFKYLDDYLKEGAVDSAIKKFYTNNSLQFTNTTAFRDALNKETIKSTDWFFDKFVQNNIAPDFRFKKVKRKGDSLTVTIIDTEKSAIPVPLSIIKNKKEVSEQWLPMNGGSSSVTLAKADVDKLVLDQNQLIPEVSKRNNFRNFKGIFNRPIQLRLLQDIEDPAYSQLFILPEFEFNNVYDGFTIGATVLNSTLIPRNFTYQIAPQYGFGSQKILGSASILKTNFINQRVYQSITYGLSFSTSSYAPDLLFRSYTPFVRFNFRSSDLRDNKRQSLLFRSINIDRDPDLENPVTSPDYSIFNARYTYRNPNLINVFSTTADYQLSRDFSKVSTTFTYRKLFLNNRELRIRFFAGAFIFNNTKRTSILRKIEGNESLSASEKERQRNFFSFALDRPSDYLFDYKYLGRSEESGLISQQIIIAEGGFKSRLETPYADQWLTTLNTGYSIWNWIHAYGDIGLVKSRNVPTNFVYDSGIRLSLVNDYFELFFPVYSNKGWEMGQPDYSQNIRFLITISPSTLIGLFNRRWY